MQKYHPQAKKLLVLSHLFLLLTFVVLSLSTCKASKPSENPQWEVIGKSGQGREIRRITFGKGPKTALLLGAVHGNEHGGRELLELVSIYLQYHPTEYEGLKIIIIPLVNPDGFFANTRLNGSGVDLNRNFPTRNWDKIAEKQKYNPGPQPGSETETKLLISILTHEKPMLIISIHQPLSCVNYDGPAGSIADVLSRATGLPIKADIGYKTPGSLGTFAGVERGIPVITLELPEKVSPTEYREKYLPALLAALKSF